MDPAALALDDIKLDDIGEVFSFLPDLDAENVAEAEPGIRPSTADYRAARRTLVNDDGDARTYQWHPTAGTVYRHEPTAQARWQSLRDDHTKDSEYKPFSSRLDWEIAQWSVKEKIPQKSFNRLLQIPQVFFLFNRAFNDTNVVYKG